MISFKVCGPTFFAVTCNAPGAFSINHCQYLCWLSSKGHGLIYITWPLQLPSGKMLKTWLFTSELYNCRHVRYHLVRLDMFCYFTLLHSHCLLSLIVLGYPSFVTDTVKDNTQKEVKIIRYIISHTVSFHDGWSSKRSVLYDLFVQRWWLGYLGSHSHLPASKHTRQNSWRPSYQYNDSHFRYKTVLRPCCIDNANPVSWKKTVIILSWVLLVTKAKLSG